jgi:hypothetical protein
MIHSKIKMTTMERESGPNSRLVRMERGKREEAPIRAERKARDGPGKPD